ncbi:MAG: M20/M25/M40 family metallo-hydrolase [Cytophagaceae bacterium]|jgi:leucyl aminopeptidase|nr:M20/M25/M40 family metallo-hydrolase [Cytophagaceae bacterium]
MKLTKICFFLIFIFSFENICADNPTKKSEEPLFATEVKSQPSIDTVITKLVSQINIDTLEYYIRHLENYGTRYYSTAQCVDAQNWIKAHFDKYGYQTELQDVRDYPSHNVIAFKAGSTEPDKYVVCGAHYDSVNSDDANPHENESPGADDNATGIAGIMEIARILSEMEFDKSIIICAFTAEEIGLHGSADYALRCKDQAMNILGYFNIDMSGYLAPELEEYRTRVIFPESARKLYNYYKTATSMYVPELHVLEGFLIWGDSDHTSFNQNGYQGIFPFEYEESPYIHTKEDVTGKSVNDFRQVQLFTQACLASVVSMARSSDIIGESTNKSIKEVTIYPNPANELINVTVVSPITKVEIYNQLGQLVFEKEYNNIRITISTEKLIQGIYLVSVHYSDKIITQKITVE